MTDENVTYTDASTETTHVVNAKVSGASDMLGDNYGKWLFRPGWIKVEWVLVGDRWDLEQVEVSGYRVLKTRVSEWQRGRWQAWGGFTRHHEGELPEKTPSWVRAFVLEHASLLTTVLRPSGITQVE